MKEVIHTEDAPKAIGPYSQAIKVDKTVYFSGQIPLDPNLMTITSDDIGAQTKQVFTNIKAVAEAAGGSLKNIVKLTIYLTELISFETVNMVMKDFFTEPYPTRTTIQVSALPKGALIEIDALMILD